MGKKRTTVITSNAKEGPYITIDYVKLVSSAMVVVGGSATTVITIRLH